MKIERYVLGDFATNCYLVSREGSSTCVLVDPAADGARLAEHLVERKLTPLAVLLTHGHYDHILAVPSLQARWGELPVYCHPSDWPADTVEYDMGQAFPTVTAFSNLRPLADAEILDFDGLCFTVIHTPGHTPGSVTFLAGSALFTGDTLFCGDVGRTDFAGGSESQMQASLNRLFALPEDYTVYPGHDAYTTLEAERRVHRYHSDF